MGWDVNAIFFEYMKWSDRHPLASIDQDIYSLWTLHVPRAFPGGTLFIKALRDLSVVKFAHYSGFYT